MRCGGTSPPPSLEPKMENLTASKFAAFLAAIENDGCGLSWAPYRDACADYSVHGLDMPENLIRYHVRAIESRWRLEGCRLPASI
jgi:hypothetical protein